MQSDKRSSSVGDKPVSKSTPKAESKVVVPKDEQPAALDEASTISFFVSGPLGIGTLAGPGGLGITVNSIKAVVFFFFFFFIYLFIFIFIIFF